MTTTKTQTRTTFGAWTTGKPEVGASLMCEVSVYDDRAPRGAKLPAVVYGRTGAEVVARANLISAAPDLLAACEEVLNHIHDEGENHPLNQFRFLDRLAGAIAKAQGKKTGGGQ